MAGLFSKLFGHILPRGFDKITTSGGGKRARTAPNTERIRDTVADERQRLAAKKRLASGQQPSNLPPEIQDQLAAFKTLLGTETAKMLAGQQMERLERQAAERLRATQSTPEYRFLNSEYVLQHGRDFRSSNVFAVWYEPGEQSIYVTFQEAGGGGGGAGASYRYWTISLAEAKSIFIASSKGKFIWDNFRIRGTMLGHRKNYALITSGSAPWKWESTPASAEAHAAKVQAQSGAATLQEEIGKFGLPIPKGNLYAALGKFVK